MSIKMTVTEVKARILGLLPQLAAVAFCRVCHFQVPAGGQFCF